MKTIKELTTADFDGKMSAEELEEWQLMNKRVSFAQNIFRATAVLLALGLLVKEQEHLQMFLVCLNFITITIYGRYFFRLSKLNKKLGLTKEMIEAAQSS